MEDKICPLLTLLIPLTKQGIKTKVFEAMKCYKENCAWWVSRPVKSEPFLIQEGCAINVHAENSIHDRWGDNG